MPKQQVPLQTLENFLPPGCTEEVLHFLNQYGVQLTISRKRASILGDYRFAGNGIPHRISVNGNLNPYGFLVTLLHELAHLLAFENSGRSIQPHGKEWKQHFGKLLAWFIQKKIFPSDIESALEKSIHNPAASTCGDLNLLRVLSKYDKKPEGVGMIEDLPENSLFSIGNGRIFRKGEKMRTRFKCQEIATGKWYLFSAVYEIMTLSDKPVDSATNPLFLSSQTK
jgi:SprT protein